MALIASVRKVQLILRQLADDARRSFNLKDTNKEILIIGLRRATISPNVPLVLQESAIMYLDGFCSANHIMSAQKYQSLCPPGQG
jgi:hypothetical protein